jgi:hypothetical protein
MMGIGVEEPAALVVRGNHLSVLGRGKVHLFLKSNGGRTLTWHELLQGDSATLGMTARQDVILAPQELRLVKTPTTSK